MKPTVFATLVALTLCVYRAQAAVTPRYAPMAPNGNYHQNSLHPNAPQTPDPARKIFFDEKLCDDLCQVPCHPTYAQDDKTLFFCHKLRPVEKSLHERLIADASWTWLAFLAVVALLVTFCCFCLCYQCCCKSKPSASNHSSREPLNGGSPHVM
ncbi:hypothetical protein AAVH_31246 [Aphelenchoides avenae]|nr:hypothetical protein AAVH_31246 [Aphelenchus avenae]